MQHPDLAEALRGDSGTFFCQQGGQGYVCDSSGRLCPAVVRDNVLPGVAVQTGDQSRSGSLIGIDESVIQPR